jgi:VanZ family protein
MKKLLHWLPAILWATVIFALSAQSALPKVGPQFPNVDKLHHLTAYGVLGALVIFPLRRAHNHPVTKAALLALLIASAYGATDEFHQRFVPNRSCDVWDWTADTIGASLAVAGYYAYESHRRQKTNR